MGLRESCETYYPVIKIICFGTETEVHSVRSFFRDILSTNRRKSCFCRLNFVLLRPKYRGVIYFAMVRKKISGLLRTQYYLTRPKQKSNFNLMKEKFLYSTCHFEGNRLSSNQCFGAGAGSSNIFMWSRSRIRSRIFR